MSAVSFGLFASAKMEIMLVFDFWPRETKIDCTNAEDVFRVFSVLRLEELKVEDKVLAFYVRALVLKGRMRKLKTEAYVGR